MKEIENLINSEDKLNSEEKEALKNIFENLNYKIHYEDGLPYVILGKMKIPLWKIQSYYNLPSIVQIECTEQQKARFESGLPLEKATQKALQKEKINFEGNPLNINHYPHSTGLHVDIDSEHMLIECTNPKKNTHMNKEIMNEKIDYFHKADPEHKKLWIIVTTFKTWDEAITERLRHEQITVLFLNNHIHTRNWKFYVGHLKSILKDLNSMAQHITNESINKVHKTINSLNKVCWYKLKNKNYAIEINNKINNTVYQISDSFTSEAFSSVCGNFSKSIGYG